MSELTLKPPAQFNFRQKQAWPDWIERFETYRLATGLIEKGEPQQIAVLIYTMGQKAKKLLKSFKLSADDEKKVRRCEEGI